MENGYENNIFEKIESDINILLRKKKNHEHISSKEVSEIDNKLNEIISNNYSSNKLIIDTFKQNMWSLRPYALKCEKIYTTKWQLFMEDINKLEGEKFDSLKNLVNLIEEKSNDTISEEELNEINIEYSNVLPIIYNNLLDFEKNRATNEINKKIKIFKNRLTRFGGDDFGSWIRALRKSKNYSLKKLESLSGITASYIHRIETGTRNVPSLSVVESLGKALGVSSQELFSKLNVNTKMVEESTQEKVTLQQLIAFNTFYLDGVKASTTQKNAIIKVITNILSSDWTDSNKAQQAVAIIGEIEALKKAVPPVKEKYIEMKNQLEDSRYQEESIEVAVTK